MTSDEEGQSIDLSILINDLKLFKMDNNLDEAADAILFYINSEQGRQEMEYHRKSRKGNSELVRELNSLISYFMAELILNRNFLIIEQFIEQGAFNEGEERATTLVNIGSYFTTVDDDLQAMD